MAVAVVVVTGLIFCRCLEPVPYHQAQLHKEFQRVVQRCPTDWEIELFIQFFPQLLKREMAVNAIYCIQDGKAFRRLSMLVQLQIVSQDIPDRYLNVFFHFMWLNG
jgi:hypothetical protein